MLVAGREISCAACWNGAMSSLPSHNSQTSKPFRACRRALVKLLIALRNLLLSLELFYTVLASHQGRRTAISGAALPRACWAPST